MFDACTDLRGLNRSLGGCSFRAADAGDGNGIRPSAEAPFQCPLTGAPLNGRARAFLHRPTGLLLSEKGLTQFPKMAREAIVEAAQASAADKRSGSKGSAGAAARDALVASGGAWEQTDMLVVNPEGEDAEDAKDRVRFIAAKVRRHCACELADCGRKLGWLWQCHCCASLFSNPALATI